jgi:hypothetical protein
VVCGDWLSTLTDVLDMKHLDSSVKSSWRKNSHEAGPPVRTVLRTTPISTLLGFVCSDELA